MSPSPSEEAKRILEKARATRASLKTSGEFLMDQASQAAREASESQRLATVRLSRAELAETAAERAKREAEEAKALAEEEARRAKELEESRARLLNQTGGRIIDLEPRGPSKAEKLLYGAIILGSALGSLYAITVIVS